VLLTNVVIVEILACLEIAALRTNLLNINPISPNEKVSLNLPGLRPILAQEENSGDE